MDISESESWNRKPLKDQKSCPPTYSKKNVLIKETHMNILFKSSNCYKTLKNTIQMNNLLRIMTSIHIYEVIKCSFSNPEKKNEWLEENRERKRSPLVAQVESWLQNRPVGSGISVWRCWASSWAVSLAVLSFVAQLISMILISAPRPSPSPGS